MSQIQLYNKSSNFYRNQLKSQRFFTTLQVKQQIYCLQKMHTQQLVTAIISMTNKKDEKIIDPAKIKSILSKKLSNKIPNPEQMVQQLDQEISYQIQKTQFQIEKERERQDKIKFVEERQLKSRSLLKERIENKLKNSQRKKNTQSKDWLQKRIKARKIKEQFLEIRKKQIYQADFKPRLQKFKEIKASNNSHLQKSQQLSPIKQRGSLLKRSFSQRNSLGDAFQKSKQIQQLNYFKKLQLLQKRKIYEKSVPKVHIPQSVDKKDWIQKLKSTQERKYIQKLGTDLWKIEIGRKRKQKQIKQKIQKMKKQAQLDQQQREYRLEILKQDFNNKLKSRKDVLSKKNQRFLTMRNKSTPKLQRNWSSSSQNQDVFGTSNGKFLGSVSNMSKTLQNFNNSMSIERAKADDYLLKQKGKKVKKQALHVIEKVLRDQKIEILMK